MFLNCGDEKKWFADALKGLIGDHTKLEGVGSVGRCE
jgi:hypothetical protein